MFRALSVYLSTLVTITGLAAVGFVGHSTHWTFSFDHGTTQHVSDHDHETDAPHESREFVRLKSDTSATASGIETSPVELHSIVEDVEANGIIEFSPQHHVRVSSRARGTLWRIEKQLGDTVKPGDVLAIVEAPEVGNLKAELLRSMTQLSLRKAIVARFESVEDAIAEKQLLEARALEREARVDLLNAFQLLANHDADVDVQALEELSELQAVEVIRFAGIPNEIKQKLSSEGANSSFVAIKSPIEGIVVQRNCAAGETVESGAMLFEVADPRQLILKIDVRREGATKIALGQKVNFQVDGHQRAGDGEIMWIGVQVNEDTRTVEARARIVTFPDGALKANCFARCKIAAAERNAMLVPSSALHACESHFVLFRKNAPDEFEAIRVHRGTEKGALVEINGDLKPGDIIATEGSHALWSALVLQRLAE